MFVSVQLHKYTTCNGSNHAHLSNTRFRTESQLDDSHWLKYLHSQMADKLECCVTLTLPRHWNGDFMFQWRSDATNSASKWWQTLVKLLLLGLDCLLNCPPIKIRPFYYIARFSVHTFPLDKLVLLQTLCYLAYILIRITNLSALDNQCWAYSGGSWGETPGNTGASWHHKRGTHTTEWTRHRMGALSCPVFSFGPLYTGVWFGGCCAVSTSVALLISFN